MQRVRVGMTGLASVLVLIALASAVFNSASRAPAEAVGASKAATVANLADASLDNSTKPAEPLAELGVAPSTTGEAEATAAK
ncbi:hypothetical protein LZK98_15475 [Sphingomonas cannabina]|uniref:hypothetical protein n=1 Tax=Sphingomonas cannabina TaxID=2899123 RepID=UPI001F34C337|nr:hypothetical protein [Sphingomonas cannabina]UIJ44452.1 hypothetical protein LZK98_15475 [Sphingomonas cannabina]